MLIEASLSVLSTYVGTFQVQVEPEPSSELTRVVTSLPVGKVTPSGTPLRFPERRAQRGALDFAASAEAGTEATGAIPAEFTACTLGVQSVSEATKLFVRT